MFKKKCPSCGVKNSKERETCIECGTHLASEQIEQRLVHVPIEDEKQIEREIEKAPGERVEDDFGTNEKILYKTKGNIRNKINNIFWKSYFFIFSFLIIIFLITEGFSDVQGNINFVLSTPSWAALFLYAYKKRFLNVRFWKPYFLIFVSYDIYHNFTSEEITSGTWLGLLFFMPIYIALYLYAFKFMNKADDAQTSI